MESSNIIHTKLTLEMEDTQCRAQSKRAIIMKLGLNHLDNVSARLTGDDLCRNTHAPCLTDAVIRQIVSTHIEDK